jgi:hypothetical protein
MVWPKYPPPEPTPELLSLTDDQWERIVERSLRESCEAGERNALEVAAVLVAFGAVLALIAWAVVAVMQRG